MNAALGSYLMRGVTRLRAENIAIGLSIFTVGLFKKCVLADVRALWADPVFTAAAAGQRPGPVDAWVGALAFAFKQYFDFSGYSDMAIGLARMFNIVLPLNFDSPYKPTNIIEFWRRWHMTLSRFLRDYLYFPLGGNRRGGPRRYANLLIVMILGGLWHGAAWTFVLWGTVHGVLLVINHAWHALRRSFAWSVTSGLVTSSPASSPSLRSSRRGCCFVPQRYRRPRSFCDRCTGSTEAPCSHL